jgi:hypothetical protein
MRLSRFAIETNAERLKNSIFDGRLHRPPSSYVWLPEFSLFASGVKATYFLVGQMAHAYPSVVRRMSECRGVAEGCGLASII